MLRETRARWLALATAAVVVGLAALFAELRNPPGAPGGPPSDGAPAGRTSAGAEAPGDAARRAIGQAAFVRLDCAGCHAIDGVGNPSSPLDGVGARLDRAALRDWTLGRGPAADELPRSIVRRKQQAAEDAGLEALIDYLQHSR